MSATPTKGDAIRHEPAPEVEAALALAPPFVRALVLAWMSTGDEEAGTLSDAVQAWVDTWETTRGSGEQPTRRSDRRHGTRTRER